MTAARGKAAQPLGQQILFVISMPRTTYIQIHTYTSIYMHIHNHTYSLIQVLEYIAYIQATYTFVCMSAACGRILCLIHTSYIHIKQFICICMCTYACLHVCMYVHVCCYFRLICFVYVVCICVHIVVICVCIICMCMYQHVLHVLYVLNVLNVYGRICMYCMYCMNCMYTYVSVFIARIACIA